MKSEIPTNDGDWFRRNLESLQSRTAFLSEFPQGVVLTRPRSMHQLCVVRWENQLQLYFYGADSSEILSRMDVHDPLFLVSPYTQAMMLALLWNSDPARVYMLGFGAGRVPMVLHHHFPSVVIDCTELDEDVMSVAQSHFGVALDRRLNVALEDGRKFLEKKTEPANYDIIFVDAFRGTGNSPFTLATREFYAHCKRHLRTGGVFSVNLLTRDKLYKDKVSTLLSSFANVHQVETSWGGNVLFATDGDSIPGEQLLARAEEIAVRHAFAFPFLEHARRLHQRSQDGRATGRNHGGRILTDSDPYY